MPTYSLYFFTATIKDWIYLLRPDKYKDLIVDSLRFLSERGRVVVYGFVVMPNHIHVLWEIREGHKKEDVQRDFLKFTAQQIKLDLLANDTKTLENFKVDLKDRAYQIWKYRPLSIELYSDSVIEQKLDYIHNNPIQEKWKLADTASEYRYSSAAYYLEDSLEWNFIAHYKKS